MHIRWSKSLTMTYKYMYPGVCIQVVKVFKNSNQLASLLSEVKSNMYFTKISCILGLLQLISPMRFSNKNDWWITRSPKNNYGY